MAEILDCRIGGWQAARIAGVKYTTMDRWIKSGLLTVTRPGQGFGSRREFSFLDLIRVRCVGHLREAGVSAQTIRRVQAELVERYGVQDPLTQTAKLVVVGGKEIFWITDEGAMLHVMSGQYAARALVVLDMPRVAQETHQKMIEVCHLAA